MNGTRILSRRTIEAIPAPLLNIHCGITPYFRGSHGGYWAVVQGRPQLAGTTVHWIDPGVDTGPIIKQASLPLTPRDSFATYLYLHLAVGVPLVIATIREFLANELEVDYTTGDGESNIYCGPTLWGYLLTRWRRGVK